MLLSRTKSHHSLCRNSGRYGTAVLLTAGALLLVAGTAPAQEPGVETLQPKEPETLDEAPDSEKPRRPAPAFADSDEVLAESITALTVREYRAEAAGDAPAVAGLTLALPSFSDEAVRAVRNELAGYLGEALTLNRLNTIVEGLVQRFTGTGYPLVDVVVPAGQEVTDGAVEVVVLLAELSAIEVSGNEHFSDAAILGATTFEAGDKLTGAHLARNLDWLNRNPFRRVGSLHRRGAEPGDTELVLRVRDRRPWRVYGGYENTGTELTGEDRLLAGFNHGNLFGRGHRLSYQGTTAMESSDFIAHSANYTVPLPWQHELRLYGMYQESDPPETAEGFDLSAETRQFGARYTVPLPGPGDLGSRFRHSLMLGYDYKESNNDLLFGGTRVQDTDSLISQFLAGYDFTRPDRAGRTSGGVRLVYGPDRDGQADEFTAQRAGADPEYFYATADLSRVTRLGGAWRWHVDIAAQWADGNLLPSEQFGIGGQATVRGYDEFAQIGDRGVLASSEVHRSVEVGGLVHSLDLYAFYDYGLVSNVDRLEGERNNRDLMSVGAGFSLGVTDYASLRVEYGRQLEPAEPGDEKDGRVHASLLISY